MTEGLIFVLHLDPYVTARHRLPTHSPLTLFENAKQAAQGASSPYRVSLNGQYLFRLYDRFEDAPDFFAEGFDASSFAPVTVPGNWETQGFGKAIYTNVHLPWDYADCGIKPGKDEAYQAVAPHVPGDNPTGCYIRQFDLPDCFAGRRTSVLFEGVETAAYVYCNGQYVGYSEDSKLPCEFDLTPFVHSGTNTLCVKVVRFASSTFLEDQDYWYVSGLHRNVWLLSRPEHAIEDYKVRAVPSMTDGSGFFSCDAFVTKTDGFSDCAVKAQLFDGENCVFEGVSPVNAHCGYDQISRPTLAAARIEGRIENVRLWQCDRPHLYTLYLTLLDENRQEIQTEKARIGFKKVEIVNGILRINGRRAVICGVNRHEHYPMGRAVPEEHMRREIREMKRMHINAVRTCHYPDSDLWYSLCDELGILVLCECDIETHAVMGAVSHDPSYAPIYVERAMRMVTTFKNHACIYGWSLGNESGYGANHAAMYGFIKEYDKDRLCQYEAGDPPANISDTRGTMYCPVPRILEKLADPEDTRPLILVEYLYQICNSGGGMDWFRKLTRSYPRFQGGFVWDWQDKCLTAKTEDGNTFFAYGGDMGENYTDPENPTFMTCNGIVLPDLTWKPVAYAIKQAYAPVSFGKAESGSPWFRAGNMDFIVYNESEGDRLSAYRCKAVVRENGVIVSETEIELPDLPVGEKGVVTLDLPYDASKECTVEFVTERREKTPFESNTDTVSVCQFPLRSAPYAPALPTGGEKVTLARENGAITVSAKDTVYVIDETDGKVLSAKKGGRTYLKDSFTPEFLRGREGQDTNEKCWGCNPETEPFGDCKEETSLSYCGNDGTRATVEFEKRFLHEGQLLAKSFLRYIADSGKLLCEYSVTLVPKIVPRAGLTLITAPDFEDMTYYAHGPIESYSDRVAASPLGEYRTTVEGEHFPFVPPSENGGHEGLRRLTLTNADGRILHIECLKPLHFDAHHSTVSDYRSAKHEHELIRREETILHIDAAHGQIGGDFSWSSGLNEHLLIGEATHEARFAVILA